MAQTAVTLLFGTAAAARVPTLGASGAIAAVLDTSASANGGGVAFFAHVGGFVFGVVVTMALLNAGRVAPQEAPRRAAFGL